MTSSLSFAGLGSKTKELFIAAITLAISAGTIPAGEDPPNIDENLVPGDLLFLRVHEDQNAYKPFFGIYQVTEYGIIDIPLVGPIPVTGRTWKNVADAVEGVLESDLEKDFHVVATEAPIVAAASNSPHQVIVMGEVMRSGMMALPDEDGVDITLVIAWAGGLTRMARNTRVKIRRKSEDSTFETINIDLNKIPDSKATLDYYKVLPGDNILVPAGGIL